MYASLSSIDHDEVRCECMSIDGDYVGYSRSTTILRWSDIDDAVNISLSCSSTTCLS